MASCKDCLHVDVCCSYLSTVYNKCKLATPDFELLKNIECDECQHFKDRSLFVELPCNVGDTVYAYWDMDNPCSNYLHVIEDFIIDLVILVDRKNSVIGFRAGRTCEQNGRKCDIEFDLKDIGKTVFLTREEAEQALRECGVK